MFTKNNKFLMLALDHRGSLRRLINPQAPGQVGKQAIIELKQKILAGLGNKPSGVLLDSEFGLPAYNRAFKDAKNKPPFILCCERSGYQEKAGQRYTEIEYTVQELKDRGASGIKLLLYFNPLLEPSRAHQIQIAKQIAKDCQANNLPLFLEILTYKEEGKKPGLMLGAIKAFLEAGVRPDVFKLEWPGSAGKCQQVSGLLKGRPWVLLSRGVRFSQFRDNLKTAMMNGAAGFLAGRALWQEAVGFSGWAQQRFLHQTLPSRFAKLTRIAIHQ